MTALYERVAWQIAKSIDEGTYPLGEQLPTEVELAQKFEVSRATIRSALGRLERVGLISRRRRVGTVVEARRPTVGFSGAVSNLHELVQYSTDTRREVVSRANIVADATLAERLEIDIGTPLTYVAMLRFHPDSDWLPLAYTDVYLNADIAERIGDKVERPDGLISDMIEHVTGQSTTQVEQRIRAVRLSKPIATLLREAAGEPCLEIRRRYRLGSDRVPLITVSTHPADRFEYAIVMERETL